MTDMDDGKTPVQVNQAPVKDKTGTKQTLQEGSIEGKAKAIVEEARTETAAGEGTMTAVVTAAGVGIQEGIQAGVAGTGGQTYGIENKPGMSNVQNGTMTGDNPEGTPANRIVEETVAITAQSMTADGNNGGTGTGTGTGTANGLKDNLNTGQDGGAANSAELPTQPAPGAQTPEPAPRTETQTDIFTERVKEVPKEAPVTITGMKADSSSEKSSKGPTEPPKEKAPEAFVSRTESPKEPSPAKSELPKDSTPPAPPSRNEQTEPRREPPQQTAPQPSQAQPPQEKQLTPPAEPTRSSEPPRPQPEARLEPRQAPAESPVTPPQQQSSPTPPSTPTASPVTPEKPQVTERAPEPSQSAKQPPAPEPRQAPTQQNTSPAEAPAPVAKQPEVRAIEKNLTLESIRERLTQQKQLETQDNREPKAREVRREEARPIEEKPKSADVKAVEIQRKIAEIVTVSQSSDAQGTKNFIEAAKTMNKLELVKAVTEAIAVALKDGNVSKVADVVKAALTDGNVRQAIRMVIQKTTGDAAPVVRRPQSSSDGSKPKLPLDQAKAIDAITQPITSKQEAMKVLLGLVVDASKLQNPVVQAVQAETASKIQTIQSSIDELLKLRVEQFMALSTKAHGVDGATLNKICHEAIQELATRHGLTDEQRAMLSRVMVQLHENDFARDLEAPKKTQDQPDGEKASQKDVKPPEAKVLSKQELEKLFREELAQLEEFLKERDEVKLKRAQEKLEALLEEASEEGMEYVIDEDYEVIKTFTLRGVVRHEKTKEPIPFAHIYAGILGTLITDGDGLFTFLNVPQDTAYMIGVDKIGMKFAPEFVTGSMTTSVDIAFLGEELI